jgi:OPA family glycerol-3-phosphate transporter-like MFS transporter
LFRWRALEATFLGYAMYYLVRNNVNVVTLEMEDALGYSRDMIGDIGAVWALSYGVSKFLMGAVSDGSDARKFMATGLMFTSICNFAFGASRDYSTHLMLWTLNGLAQGMGWPPCGRVMGHWFSESERGLTFSIWNTSHNVGGGIAGVLAAWTAHRFGGWQFAFYVPGAVTALGAFYLLWRLRDTPQSVGLPPIEEYRGERAARIESAAELERDLTFRELLFEKVLPNKYVWLLAFANFFAYIARYSMIDWSPTYLREVKGADLQKGGFAIMAIEFGGIPSTILLGWISDRIGGRRSMVAALCMLPVIAAFGAIIATPAGYLWIDYLLLMTIGCFIYPVINLIVIAALDIVSKKAIGTAAGFIGLFGYLGRTVQASGFGRAVKVFGQEYGTGQAWQIVLYTILVCAAIAAMLLAIMWRTKPRA